MIGRHPAGPGRAGVLRIEPDGAVSSRLTRAIIDLAMAQQAIRFYAMSPSILGGRAGYYRILEAKYKGTLECLTACSMAANGFRER